MLCLMQINKLREVPGIKDVSQLPLLSSVVEVFLPSLVLRIFLVILPYLLDYMGRIEGLASLSAVQFSVVKKLFAFQVCLPPNGVYMISAKPC